MIVMSKAARHLLIKMQEMNPSVEYETCDIEWYAHNVTLSILCSWWKVKKKFDGSVGSSYQWYLPVLGSQEYAQFLKYVHRLKSRIKGIDIDWTSNHKQVYHYLCSSVLDCDFNLAEFKLILDIGSEFSIQDVQQVVDKVRGSVGANNVQYIMATLQRGKQAKDVKVQRISEAISLSQKSIRKISSKCCSAIDVALMKSMFNTVKEEQNIDKEIKKVVIQRLTRRY